MNPLSDKAFRKTVSEYLLALRQQHQNDHSFHLSLSELDGLISNLTPGQREANRTIRQQLASEMFLCHVLVITVGTLSLIIDDVNPDRTRLFPADWLAGMQCPDPDYIVQGLLTQIANHGLAVLRLLEDGLDNPARVVVRTLWELSWQLIVLSSDQKAFAQYASAKTPEEADNIWYKLLRSKQLLKRIEAINRDLKMPSGLTTTLVDSWKKTYKNLSQDVHPSSISVLFGSTARSLESEWYYPVLYGRAVEASRYTVGTAIDALGAVVMYFPMMLDQLYGFSTPEGHTQWRTYWSLRELAMDFCLHISKEGEKS